MRSTPERHNEGASAVEFVFVLPLLVILVFGIIQFGIAFNRSQGMHASIREGARLASIGADVTDIEQRVGDALDGTTVDRDDVAIEIRRYADGADPTDLSAGTLLTTGAPCDGTPGVSHAVRVDVEVRNPSDYAITIPLLPTWNPDYQSRAIFRCED